MQARRRARERDRPAAAARRGPGSSTLGRPSGESRTSMTCAHRGSTALRAVQGRPGRTGTPQGGSAIFVSPGSGSRFEAFSLVTGLPAALAVLAALPLGLLPAPAGPPSPRSAPSSWASPSRCCPCPGGAPAPPAAAPSRRISSRSSSRPARSSAISASRSPPAAPAAARSQHAAPHGIVRNRPLIGHAPQAPTHAATRQTGKRGSQPDQAKSSDSRQRHHQAETP